MNIYPFIMAGGSGTRFWPRSRNATPKQILKITSDKLTMIQMAYQLVNGLVPNKNFIQGTVPCIPVIFQTVDFL